MSMGKWSRSRNSHAKTLGQEWACIRDSKVAWVAGVEQLGEGWQR
jgi:hypothetical protein